jgi:hypothetical protein
MTKGLIDKAKCSKSFENVIMRVRVRNMNCHLAKEREE